MKRSFIAQNPSVLWFLLALSLFTIAVTALSEAGIGVLSTSFVKTLGKTLCLCLIAIAMDVVWGYCGILSLGHFAFFGIGGYAIGMVAGCLMAMLESAMNIQGAGAAHAVMVIFGAMAISLAMFTMVVTRTEHPPAAALALGLVLNEWNLLTLAVVMAGIVALSLIKRLVLPMLLDLI